MVMDFDNFIDDFNRGLAKNDTIVIFCNCGVKYSGRAESQLPQGDRLIIVKADNSLLIHQPEGTSPVNYMKPKSQITATKNSRHVDLIVRNLSTKDFLEIEIWGVYDFVSSKLEDGQKLLLQGNERDMSDMIYENPSMISPDFTPLAREEHTKYGFIDVFGHNKNGELVIVECKRYTASLSCVTQLRRYVEKIKDLKGTDKVTGILAAPDITSNAKKMLEDWGYSYKKVNPPKRLERYNNNQTNLFNY